VKTLVGTLFFICMATPAQAADAFPMGTGLLRMLWALLVVSGIILFIFALAKKRFGLGSLQTGTIKILEIRRIMPKNTLALVEVHGKVMLLGIGTEQITLLQDFPQKPTEEADFETLLNEQQ